MMFVLIEHDTKPIKVQGNKIVPATVSPLRFNELKEGEYIGVITKKKIKLISFGGFIGYIPKSKNMAYLSSDVPATLDEYACNATNGELFVLIDIAGSAHHVIFSQILTQNWVNSDFWIPSLFYQNDTLVGEGWFIVNQNLNQAIILNATIELKPPIRINAINDPSIMCKCIDIYSFEYYEYTKKDA